MWMERLLNGKYKYFERYKDPYTEKWKRVSITLDSGSNRAKKEAQKALDDKISNILSKATSTDTMFNTAFMDWWEVHKNDIKNSSTISLNASVKRVQDLFAQDVKVANITPKYIQDFLNHQNWTYSVRYRFKSLLNLFFDYAIDMGYIDTNPARKVKLPKNTKRRKTQIEDKYFEPQELSRLLEELKRRDATYRYYLYSEFMVLDGCRIGELSAVQLNDYRKEQKELSLFETYDKYTDDEPTSAKTAESERINKLTKREIEIIEEIIEMNKFQELTNPKWIKSDFIFVTSRGNVMHRNMFNAVLKRANQRLDNPIDKNISSHYFRHTMVSVLAEKNVPLKAIMERVGHADSKTTTEIYTHVTRNMRDHVLTVLEDFSIILE